MDFQALATDFQDHTLTVFAVDHTNKEAYAGRVTGMNASDQTVTITYRLNWEAERNVTLPASNVERVVTRRPL